MIAPVQFRYRAEAEAGADGWEMSAEPWSVLWRPESVEGPRGLLTLMRNSPVCSECLQGAFAWAAYVQHDGIALRVENEACRTGKLAVHAQAGPGDEAGHSSPLASPILLGINALGEKYFPSTLQKLAFKSHCDPFLLEIRENFA